VVTPNTLRTPVLTWDDSPRPRCRRRLGRLHPGPGRMVTFCSGIAFPSTHDHGALCPRQVRSASADQAVRCSAHKRRTTVRSYTMAGARRGVGQHWTHGNSAPHGGRPAARSPPWPVPAVLASPRRLARGTADRALGHHAGNKGGSIGAYSTDDASRPRPAAAPPGQAFPRYGQARLPRPRRPGGYPRARLP
jgi:hypothetical protein